MYHDFKVLHDELLGLPYRATSVASTHDILGRGANDMSDSNTTVITITPRGPYVCSGPCRVIDTSGHPVPNEMETFLCRCGYSKNKPLCDGAHGPYQFNKGIQPEPDTGDVTTYCGKVEVRYNPAICAHLGVCTSQLPEVFDTARRPWILPDNANAAQVIDTINRCPSGALTAHITTTEPIDTQDAIAEPTIRAQKNGPLAIQGQVEIEDITWPDGAVRDRFTLCRCGASRTMPFCDGSHGTVGFIDE